MAFVATVIQVMIASPGDVTEERDIIRKVLHDWNDLNSRKEGVVLLPVGWDTHSASDLSGRAQDQINGRLLERCDLLVGVFWTRLGTPTGEHASGTVEEIKRHVEAGRTAMVYFSSRPIVPGSYEEQQFQGVLQFKNWCKTKGIISTFESADGFLKKFSSELQIILRDNPYLNALTERPNPIESAIEPGIEAVKISALSMDILTHAAEDKRGVVMITDFIGGTNLVAGTKSYDLSSGHREVARHKAAVEELENHELIKGIGYKGEVFRVTNAGYELVEAFKRQNT